MHLDLPVFNTVEEAMKAVQVQHAVLLLFFLVINTSIVQPVSSNIPLLA